MDIAYEEACYRAAEHQGLSEPTLRLATAGFITCVDQTGGMTMCLRVDAGPRADDSRPEAPPEGSYVWVTREGPDCYLVCLYPWDKADPESEPMCESTRDTEVHGPDLPGAVSAFLTGRPNWDGENWHHQVDGHILSFDECEAEGLDGTLRDR